jgi:predicted HTH domain antitoxin
MPHNGASESGWDIFLVQFHLTVYHIIGVLRQSDNMNKGVVPMQLRLQVPERLTGKNQQQLEALAFEALVVRLYSLGELSSGEGAKLLGLTRREFLDLLNQYNVSLFDDSVDVRKEAGYE